MVKPIVDIAINGPGGSVVYREAGHEHRFDWELGGKDVVATIYVPSPVDWDARIPWAAGRRGEILATLAREVSRQKCRRCVVEVAERWIYLREPPPFARRIVSALGRFVGSFRESA